MGETATKMMCVGALGPTPRVTKGCPCLGGRGSCEPTADAWKARQAKQHNVLYAMTGCCGI